MRRCEEERRREEEGQESGAATKEDTLVTGKKIRVGGVHVFIPVFNTQSIITISIRFEYSNTRYEYSVQVFEYLVFDRLRVPDCDLSCNNF